MGPPPVALQFGARVRDLRRRRGWSQEAFAGRVGLDRSYLGGVERGERNVSLANIAAIADGLGVTLAALFAYDTLPPGFAAPAPRPARVRGRT